MIKFLGSCIGFMFHLLKYEESCMKLRIKWMVLGLITAFGLLSSVKAGEDDESVARLKQIEIFQRDCVKCGKEKGVETASMLAAIIGRIKEEKNDALDEKVAKEHKPYTDALKAVKDAEKALDKFPPKAKKDVVVGGITKEKAEKALKNAEGERDRALKEGRFKLVDEEARATLKAIMGDKDKSKALERVFKKEGPEGVFRRYLGFLWPKNKWVRYCVNVPIYVATVGTIATLVGFYAKNGTLEGAASGAVANVTGWFRALAGDSSRGFDVGTARATTGATAGALVLGGIGFLAYNRGWLPGQKGGDGKK
jgi:hypothetical protein